MNRKALVIITTVILLTGLIAGCTKTNPVVFSWDYGGRHYVADSSSVSNTTNYIIAAESGLTALAISGGGHLPTGTYSFHGYNNSGLPFMAYAEVNTFVYSQSGTLTITYNDNTKISGSFSVTFTDASTMSGSFADIPIR